MEKYIHYIVFTIVFAFQGFREELKKKNIPIYYYYKNYYVFNM